MAPHSPRRAQTIRLFELLLLRTTTIAADALLLFGDLLETKPAEGIWNNDFHALLTKVKDYGGHDVYPSAKLRNKNAMFISIVAAIVFLVGAGGLVLSSLAPILGDGFFNFAAVCLVAGPLIFFFYVIIGLFLEFVGANRPPVAIPAVGQAAYAAASLIHFAYDQTPEGLQRERKGPMNPSRGRADKI